MSVFLAAVLALLSACAVTGWLVRSRFRHSRRLADDDLSGPQKFHEAPVPRVGGIGIAAGLWAAAAVLYVHDAAGLGQPALLLLLCGLPTLLAGLAEDMTKSVRPRTRLLCTALSAGLAMLALGATVQRTDLPGLDWLASFAAGAALITVVSVVGVANSINLIDGLNGLASTCVVIMLAGLAVVAWRVGDPLVLALALAGVGSALGFLLWNFPRGLVFLGDGGAYFLGFWLAEAALLLLVRNPQVSPMCALLLVIYPVFETVFSMYRRRVLKRRPLSQPDGAHLHSLIFRRFMRADFAALGREQRVRRNSMTSPFLWLLTALSVVPAVVFWDRSNVLILCGAGFVVVYLTLYWRIVRFRAPRWLAALPVTHRRRRSLHQA